MRKLPVFFDNAMAAPLLIFELATWATVAVAAATVYSVVQQRRSTKEATKTAEELGKQQLATQQLAIGQSANLTRQQMELQAGAQQINTLADLITETQQIGPRVLQTPATGTLSALDQINAKIHAMLTGR